MCDQCGQYVSWVTDAYGRSVPVLMAVQSGSGVVYTSTFADGFALPQGILNAVSRNHPRGRILRADRADCAGCFWNVWVCDQGRHFLMQVDNSGRIFQDALR